MVCWWKQCAGKQISWSNINAALHSHRPKKNRLLKSSGVFFSFSLDENPRVEHQSYSFSFNWDFQDERSKMGRRGKKRLHCLLSSELNSKTKVWLVSNAYELCNWLMCNQNFICFLRWGHFVHHSRIISF